MTRILGISGSLRAGSFNTALLRAAQALQLEGVELEVVTLHGIPLYDGDLEQREGIPAAVAALKEKVVASQGVLLATPEYNSSLPGVLKNAIDWLSRPGYKSVLRGKPTLIMSAAASAGGGIRAQAQLKQCLAGTLTPVYLAPEFAIGNPQLLFQDGRLTDADGRKRLERLLREFREWVAAGLR